MYDRCVWAQLLNVRRAAGRRRGDGRRWVTTRRALDGAIVEACGVISKGDDSIVRRGNIAGDEADLL